MARKWDMKKVMLTVLKGMLMGLNRAFLREKSLKSLFCSFFIGIGNRVAITFYERLGCVTLFVA